MGASGSLPLRLHAVIVMPAMVIAIIQAKGLKFFIFFRVNNSCLYYNLPDAEKTAPLPAFFESFHIL
jgi:hypothetical protein